MPLTLPTDTQHLQPETRQYEIFNKPLGNGVERAQIYTGVFAFAVWAGILAVVGLNPLTQFGAPAYLVPPFLFVYAGCRKGDDGRRMMLLWYDALLAKLRFRRHIITNPVLDASDHTSQDVLVLQVTTAVAQPHPDRAHSDPKEAPS